MKNNLKISKHKYIHIFYHPGTMFFHPVYEMLQNNLFDMSEHLFVTPYEEDYEKIKHLGNVILVKTKKYKSAKLINLCGDCCDWLILHAMCTNSQVLFIKRKYLKKIIWRSWGHDAIDIGIDLKNGVYSFFRSLIKFLLVRPAWKRRTQKFKVCGGANLVDELKLYETFGRNISFKQMPYGDHLSSSIFSKIKEEKGLAENEVVSVMIGHSGTIADNHFEMIRKLEKWKDKKVKVHIMCPYMGPGDIPRFDMIEQYVNQTWNNNVVIEKKMRPYEEYLHFINDMDVIILDGKESYALGNVCLAVSFEKKIFLNRYGIIKKAFDIDGLPNFCTDEIDNMSWEDFTKPVKYSMKSYSSLFWKSRECVAKKWYELFSALDK